MHELVRLPCTSEYVEGCIHKATSRVYLELQIIVVEEEIEYILLCHEISRVA